MSRAILRKWRRGEGNADRRSCPPTLETDLDKRARYSSREIRFRTRYADAAPEVFRLQARQLRLVEATSTLIGLPGSLSSKHVEEVGFRERSLGDSVPADVEIARPQDDVLNLRV